MPSTDLAAPVVSESVKAKRNHISALLQEHASLGNLKNVRMLLSQGADPNYENAVNGWTPLHWSAKRGHVAVLEELVKFGGDLTKKTKNGTTIWQIATDEVKEVLKEFGYGGNKELELIDTRDSSESVDDADQKKEVFVPHYLRHPDLSKIWNDVDITSEPMTPSCVSQQSPSVKPSESAKRSTTTTTTTTTVITTNSPTSNDKSTSSPLIEWTLTKSTQTDDALLGSKSATWPYSLITEPKLDLAVELIPNNLTNTREIIGSILISSWTPISSMIKVLSAQMDRINDDEEGNYKLYRSKDHESPITPVNKKQIDRLVVGDVWKDGDVVVVKRVY